MWSRSRPSGGNSFRNGARPRAKKNAISSQFAKATPEQRQALKEQSTALDKEIGVLDDEFKLVEDDLLANLILIPNMTHPDAPVGSDAAANKVVAKFGEKPKFDFKPKDHVALLRDARPRRLRGRRQVAGQKFYFLKNEAGCSKWPSSSTPCRRW